MGVLSVGGGATLNLRDVTIANGNDPGGGGIFNLGTLNVTHSAFSNNTAPVGGGIFNRARST